MPSRPYGNDFIVGTPYLDKMGERLYAEERQRDLQRQREMAELDNLVNKEVGKMRSVDTGDFIKKYQEYKNLRLQGIRDKNIQKDPILLNKLNQDANLRLAEVMQLAQQSAELKDQYKNLASQRAKDPNAFQDDFLDRYSAAMSTPISQLNQHPKYGNLADLNGYAYQGGNTDFSKVFKNAEGMYREVSPFDAEEDPQDKFKRIQRSYKVKNDPLSYYNNLVEGVYGSKRTRDFPIQYKYTPEQEANLEAQFNKLIKDDKYKKIFGIKENADFPASAYTTELGRSARLKAMEYALEAANQPVEVAPKRIDNKEAIMDRNFEDWKKKNEITSAQAYQRALIARQGATSGYNPTSGNAFDEIPDMNMQSGKKIVNGTVYNADGTPYSSPSGNSDIFIPKNKLPSSVLTSLKAAGIDPSQIGEGVNISVKDGVITTMETKRNGVISRQNMENYQKAFNKEPMKSAQPSFGKPVFQPTQTTNKSKGGGVPEKVERKYSKDELLKGGWTQDQINKAVKAGKIKLK